MSVLVPAVTSVMFYVGIEGEGGIDIMNKLSKKGLESPVRLEGDTPELGDFEIQIVDGRLILYKNVFFFLPALDT